jgi:hypothetical protein
MNNVTRPAWTDSSPHLLNYLPVLTKACQTVPNDRSFARTNDQAAMRPSFGGCAKTVQRGLLTVTGCLPARRSQTLIQLGLPGLNASSDGAPLSYVKSGIVGAQDLARGSAERLNDGGSGLLVSFNITSQLACRYRLLVEGERSRS